MADVVYVAVTVVFFWLSWQLVKLCEAGGIHANALRRRGPVFTALPGLPGDCAAEAGAFPTTANGLLHLVFYVVVLLLLAKPLGAAYMARVYEGRSIWPTGRWAGWSGSVYRLLGVRGRPVRWAWQVYALTMLLFNVAGAPSWPVIWQRVQGRHP